MLSKNNKILIGCLALLLVMSVGYALFSDTIEINGSATAKGDFEITTEAVDLSADVFSDVLMESPSKGIVENPIITVNDNVINTSVTLGAPGSYQYFGIKVTNTGSIPAKLKSISDKVDNILYSVDELEENQIVNIWYYFHADNGNDRKNSIEVNISADSGVYDDYASSLEERWKEMFTIDYANKDAVLDPGEFAYFFIYFCWNSNSEKSPEPFSANWKVEFNWEQVTE